MYLSRLVLDPRHPHARRDLASPYEMHRTLSRAFAMGANSVPVRFLWRLERNADGGPATVVLVQSAERASWDALAPLQGYAAQVLGNKQVDLDALIRLGRPYRFRLLANPTVTRERKRYGLTCEQDQLSWLARQGVRNGFIVRACVRTASERLKIRQGRMGNKIVLDTALFEGVMEAQSVDLLRKSLLNGLGHGKAFGLGMLSLAKVARPI